MAAAHVLAGAGRAVTVLEAKDRVGGRTHSDPDMPGGPLDFGGMLIGETHERSRALGESLGLTVVPARPAGRMAYRIRGEMVLAPDSGYPNMVAGSEGFDEKLAEAYGKFDELAMLVGSVGPWDGQQERALDAMTVATWLEQNVADEVVRQVMDTDLNIIIGAATSEVSMLFWAQYVAKCEGMHSLQVKANVALWAGGSQQISERIARQPNIAVTLEAPVYAIEYASDRVVVHSTRGSYEAPDAIIAIPPAAGKGISFSPELPLRRRQLQARAPMARQSKVQVRFSRPFWRDADLSGEIFDVDVGYLALDVTRPGDSWATIVTFIGGKDYDAWYQLGEEGRRAAVIDSLAAALGPQAAAPLSYHEADWPSVAYTLGAPVTVMPPGLLSTIGTALSDPVGPLRFAGTEAAPMWTGYMEGAVRAGEAAAQSILDAGASGARTCAERTARV